MSKHSGVTQFFRDGEVWRQFQEHILPELLARRTADLTLRAWVVGCSTGEEAYSLAMTFAETVHRQPKLAPQTLQIFATDISSDAIATARRGEYSRAIESAVPAARLARFFTKHDDHYRIAGSIRDMVLFSEQDVVLDPPFTRLEILSCRNPMIYFDAPCGRSYCPCSITACVPAVY